MKSILDEYVEKVKKNHHRYRRYMTVVVMLALVTIVGVNVALRQDGIAVSVESFFGLEDSQDTEKTSTDVVMTDEEISAETDTTDASEEEILLDNSDEAGTELILGDEEEDETEATEVITEQASTIEYSDDSADVEDAATWGGSLPGNLTGNWADDLVTVAMSQIGYHESTANFRYNLDMTEKKGYTRYGAWYGNQYGDWSAMFAAFALHYAGISKENMPVNSGCEAWIVQLKEADLYSSVDVYEGKKGDLIFLDQDGEDDKADHVAVITEVKTDNNGDVTGYKVVEGDLDDQVQLTTIDTDNNAIIGFGRLPENPAAVENNTEAATEENTEPTTETSTEESSEAGTEAASESESESEIETELETETECLYESESESETESETESESETQTETIYYDGEQKVETDNYIVTVTYGADAQIPDDAQLSVTEYDTLSEEYQKACDETGETYDWLMDISFYQSAGNYAKAQAAKQALEEREDTSEEVPDIEETPSTDQADIQDETDSAASDAAEENIDSGDRRVEIEPAAAISISVKAKNAEEMVIEDNAEMKIVHFAEDGTEEKSGDDLNIEEDKKGRTEVSFEVESLSLVAGVTYHSATASTYSAYTYGNNLLVYKQSGEYVYFLAGSSSGIVTFRVALSDLEKPGTGTVTADDVTVSGKTFYARDSISGTIMNSSGGYSSSLSWSALVWNEAGLSLVNKATGTYLSLNNTLGLTSSYQEVHAKEGSQDTSSSSGTKSYTRLYQDVTSTTGFLWWTTSTTTYYWLEFSNNQFTYNGAYNTTGYITDEVVPKAADVTIALVGADTAGTEKEETTVGESQAAVYTGKIADLPLGFYTVTMDDNHNVSGLSGVSYTIFKSDGSVAGIITTDGSMQVDLSSLNLGNGTYTMKMTTVPSGYLLNTETWTFTISAGKKTLDLTDGSGSTTGIVLVNPTGKLDMDKTASVVSYDGRTYQVDLSAKSTLEQLQIDNLTLNLVVDQSNSMLFPANLVKTKDDTHVELNSNGYLNIKGGAKTTKVYYFIADQNSTATVFAVVYRNGAWYYQDASYYAKAYYGTNSDKITTSDVIAFPDGVTNYNKNRNAGRFGGTNSVSGSNIDRDTPTSGTISYTLYESANEYNRLHYLEQSMSDMLQMLAQINPNATVVLDTFTKKSPSELTCISRTLNASGLSDLQNAIGNITTGGGTRQDIALQHVYKNHTSQQSGNIYTVLITDGAPVDDNKNEGVATEYAALYNKNSKNNTVYHAINYWANYVKSTGKLITVGLGMKNVPNGSKMLRYISSDKVSIYTTPTSDHGNWWYQPENASDLMDILTNQILNSITTGTKVGHNCETVTDEISDSFYPINPSTNAALRSGTYIDKNGYVLSSSDVVTAYKGKDTDGTWVVRKTKPSSGDWTEIRITNVTWTWSNSSGYIASRWDPVGTVTQASDGSWSVVWDGANLNQSTAWSGRIYLKAKEDFVGGNGIATNKEANITLHTGGSYELETPTVNVRLLGMNQNGSEVTVYKGDIINEAGNTPLDALKTLFSKTEFTKLVSGSGNVYNKVKDKSTGTAYGQSDGVKESTFTLEYAFGRSLTEEEWTYLTTADSDDNYPSLTIPYTYNDADGEVGYFTISLNKQSDAEGQTADFGEHTADVAKGSPNANKSNQIETYTVSVTYTAYRLAGNGETKVDGGKRPDTNVHNGANGPGTEVGGTGAGQSLETGLGTETSVDTHKVYAIEGSIKVYKEIEDKLKSDTDQTYEFTLWKVTTDSSGNQTTTQVGKSQKVTVKANAVRSETYAEWTGLERGTYTVNETAGDGYVVEKFTIKDATNCANTGDGTTSVTFTMGNDTTGTNVIGKKGTDLYTSYTGTPNGVYGEAVITNKKQYYEAKIPVKKIWSDGNNNHTKDAVYLVLYQNDTLVKVDDGSGVAYAQVIKLDSSNNWQGSFTVQVNKQNALPEGYSVRELKTLYTGDASNRIAAKLVTDDSTVYFLESDLLQEKEIAQFDKKGYGVYYTTEGASDTSIGTLVVNNKEAYALPHTGGSGTTPFVMSGLLLMAGGLLYGYVLRRRRERRSV